MAVGVEHRSTRHSRFDHQNLLLPDLNIVMSYDALGLGSGIESKALPVQGFPDHIHTSPAAPTDMAASHAQSSKKRRSSKGKTLPEIRRSSSTPHMRNLALATSGELSPTSDKRRNKLGYHRTSVACAHCRRRKIRCLLSNDDPQGRCSNCIRLKKECNFYPVEQTNPPDSRPQAVAKLEGSSTTPSTSNPSSPHPTATSKGEQADEYRPFTTITPNPVGAGFRMQSDVEVDPNGNPNPSGVPLRSHTFPYTHQMDSQWPPQGFVPPSSIPEEPPTSAGYWRASSSTAPSTYGSDSNLSGGQTPATMSTTSNISYGAPHEGQGWVQPGQPARSLSYGNVEGGVPPQFQNPHLIPQQDYRGRASPYNYPPTIDTSAGHAHGVSHPDASAPHSAPLLAHPAPNYGYPQNWSPYTLHSSGNDYPGHGRHMGGPWYQEPGHLVQVEEETGQPLQYTSHPPAFYSGP